MTNSIPKRFTVAALATCLSAGITTPGLADQTAAANDDFQAQVGQPANFFVTDTSANAFVSEVRMANGESFTEFYRPRAVHYFLAQEDAGQMIRLVRRNVGGNGVSRTELSHFVNDEPAPAVTQADRQAFARSLTDAFISPYLNDYIDVNADVGFGFIIQFDMTLMDNDPGPDDFGELLWFERGPGAGNSWLTLQAVTREGEPLGPPLGVGPAETVDMTPPTRSVGSTQTFGATGVDLSRLGVSETEYLLVRATTAAERTYAGDLQPDFKFMAVITHPDQLEEIEDNQEPEVATITSDIGIAYD